MANGRLPDRDLGTIPGTTHRVLKALVPQTAALREAFEKRFGRPLLLTDSYRTYAVQERIFRARYTPYTVTGIDPRWWNGRIWWRRPGMYAAAVPGESNHGDGQAIDWASLVNKLGTDEQRWMAFHAPKYGWVWPDWARRHPTLEPWHYEAAPTPVNFPKPDEEREPLPNPDVIVPDPIEEEDWFDMATESQLKKIIEDALDARFGPADQTDPVTGVPMSTGTQIRNIRINTTNLPQQVWDHQLPDPARAGKLTPVRTLFLWARQGIVDVKNVLIPKDQQS